MQKKILEFGNLLRKSGVRVSMAESIDAFQALDELSLGDREVFQDALRATMVKRSEEIPTFDQLFELYWSAFYDNLRAAFNQAGEALSGEGFDLEQPEPPPLHRQSDSMNDEWIARFSEQYFERRARI